MRAPLVGVLLLGLIAAGCGSGPPEIVLDPIPTATDNPTTLTSDDPAPEDDDAANTSAVTPESAAVGREWVDETANLEGMQSWCGNLAFMSARPDRDEILASVAGQGLFVNRADSEEWVPFGRGELSAPLQHRTSSIIYDPDDPNRFWESGFFGLGPPPDAVAADVNRTDDGGETFIGLGKPVVADLVSIDFSDPQRNTLVVGGHGRPEVHRSRDGGLTWENISVTGGDAMGFASFPHVIDSETYLVGAHGGVAAGIFRTTNGGQEWTRMFDRAVSGPPLASADGNIYWVMEQGGIVASSDLGVSWEPLTNRAPAGGTLRGRIVELDDGTWITMGVESLIVSDDQGSTWRSVGPSFPFQPKGFTYSTVRKAAYVWQNYCDFDAGPNPVAAESIARLDLDLDP